MEILKSTHRKSMGFLRFQMFVILTIHWFHSTNWTSRKTAQLEPSYEYLKRRRGVSKRTFWTANQLKRSWSNPLVTLSPIHTNTIVWYCSARYMLENGVTQASLKSAECNAFFKASCICISWSLAPGNEIFESFWWNFENLNANRRGKGIILLELSNVDWASIDRASIDRSSIEARSRLVRPSMHIGSNLADATAQSIEIFFFLRPSKSHKTKNPSPA